MKSPLSTLSPLLIAMLAAAQPASLTISSWDPSGRITWTNAFAGGVCTVETATSLEDGMPNQWLPQQNYFTTNSTGQGFVQLGTSNQFVRLLAVDISPNSPSGFTNLLQSYGHLRTIAGNGAGRASGVNYWQSEFEDGYATNATLSRPHFAMADAAGNVFIVDKDSHSVLKVTPDGRIHTVAGTHERGSNGDGPAPATTLMLNQPNGLYVHPNGAYDVLDTGNGAVRRVDTNGIITTLFKVPGGMLVGRGLWVDESGSQALICDGTAVKAWNPTNGVTVLNNSFIELGTLIVASPGKALVTDRGDDAIYWLDLDGPAAGTRTRRYGQGRDRPIVEGTSAVTNCLNGVRGIWPFPTGGYLLALHEGSRVLYVDPADRVLVFLEGVNGAYSGDGEWFHSPGYKMAQARSVTMDHRGHVIIVENDAGYVRQIDFQRLSP